MGRAHSATAMDLAAAVPSARSGRWDFCWLAQRSGGCHRGWCWWDRAGDFRPGPSPQLDAEFRMDPGPQGDASMMNMLTFCWRTAEGKTEKTKTQELVGDEEVRAHVRGSRLTPHPTVAVLGAAGTPLW